MSAPKTNDAVLPPPPADPSRAAKAGLEDVVAGPSSICFIDGKLGRLVYRGYDIADLQQGSFEETIHLLLFGELPNKNELARLKERLLAERKLPREVTSALMTLPHGGSPMAELRSAVSLLGLYDPDTNADPQDTEANQRKALRLVAQIPLVVTSLNSLRRGKDLIQPSKNLGHAANFLYMLSGEVPDPRIERMFDVALTLHADH